MKTKLYYRICLIMTMVSVFAVSCKKEDNTPVTPVTPGPVIRSVVTPGVSVVDYGMENGTVRTMRTVLTTDGFTITDTTNNVTYAGRSAVVALTLYINTDGIIPSGVYIFSDSDTKLPFTFDTGSLVSATDSTTNKLFSDDINKGKIIVTQDGYNYKFNINVGLLLGKKLSTDYSGTVNYLDEQN